LTEIPLSELFAVWTPDLATFAALFGFVLFAIAAIALITAPVTGCDRAPRRTRRLAGSSNLLGGLR
jgi:hypothetical protein